MQFFSFTLKVVWGTSLPVQWLRLHTSNAGDTALIPCWGTKIPHATQHGQNINIDK